VGPLGNGPEREIRNFARWGTPQYAGNPLEVLAGAISRGVHRPGVVAEGHHVIEGLSGKLVDGLGSVTAQPLTAVD
jgi:hypothetical protein